ARQALVNSTGESFFLWIRSDASAIVRLVRSRDASGKAAAAAGISVAFANEELIANTLDVPAIVAFMNSRRENGWEPFCMARSIARRAGAAAASDACIIYATCVTMYA